MYEFTKTQTELLECPSSQILFGGAAGGSKSHGARLISIIYATQISNLQIYLFRRHNQDIINNHFSTAKGNYPDLLKDLISDGICSITYNPAQIKFANGSSIMTHHMQDQKALQSLQGAEIHLAILEESTQLTEEMYRFIRSRVRMTIDEKMQQEIDLLSSYIGTKVALPKIICTSNPGGISHKFFKQTFIDPAPPKTQFIDNESGMTTYYIPSKLTDNPYLDQTAYRKQLEGLGNPSLIQAYLDGDWNVILGGSVFDQVWKPDSIIIPSFKIPKNWQVTRAADYGFHDPFACVWIATSNGETVTKDDGSEIFSESGDKFIIFEYSTGSDQIVASEVAKQINKIDEILGPIDVKNSPIDSQVFQVTNGKSIYEDFKKEKCYFIPCSKGPGSRAAGLQKLCEMFDNVRTRRGPALKIFDNCRQVISELPVLPRSKTNPEDAETTGVADHFYDATRYGVTVKHSTTQIRHDIIL